MVRSRWDFVVRSMYVIFLLAASLVWCVDCGAAPTGAHGKHATFPCTVCHYHNGGVSFDKAGPAYEYGWPAPSYDVATHTCTNVACHSVPRGTFRYYFVGGDGEPVLNVVPYGGVPTGATSPDWYGTSTSGSCTGCHDNPPYTAPNQYVWHSGWHGGVNLTSARNPDILGYNKCDLCHPDVTSTISGTPGTANAQMTTTITDAGMHGNGVVDVQGKFGERCFGCH